MTALANLSQNTVIPTDAIAAKAVTSSKQFLDVQFDKGENSNYVSAVNSQPLNKNAGGFDLEIAYTPTVNCWWEVTSFVGLLRSDTGGGVSSYFYAHTNITAGVLSGDYGTWPLTTYAIGTQANDNGPFTHRCTKTLFPLTAGIPYQAKIYAQMVGAWSYYQDEYRLSMIGKAWAR